MNKQRILLLGIPVLSCHGGIAPMLRWGESGLPAPAALSWPLQTAQQWCGVMGTPSKLLYSWRNMAARHAAVSCCILPAFTGRATGNSHHSFLPRHGPGEVMMGSPKVSTVEWGLACIQGIFVSLTAGREVTVIGAHLLFTLSFRLLS